MNVTLAIALASALLASAAQAEEQGARSFLRKGVGLSEAQIQAVDAGGW